MATPVLRVVKGSSEADIDAVNRWMRSTPWYQALVSQWGGHPGDSDARKKQIIQAAQANGVQVDEGNIEVDNTGNFNPIGHKLRNTLIAGGIAGGALLGGPAVAGLFGGGGVPAEGGLLASTAAPMTGSLVPATAAGAGTAAGVGSAAGTAAGIGGGVAAASKGLGAGFWGPVLGAGISTAGGIIGGMQQAGAEKEAAALQAQSAKEALDFLKQRYAQQIADFAPYGQAARGGLGMATSLLGIPLPSQAATPGPSNPAIPSGQWNPNEPAGTTHQGGVGQPVDFAGGTGRADATFGGTSGPLFAGGQAGPVSNSGTVTMIAPDGSVKAVPGALVGFWQARGAKPLGSAV